MLKHPSIWVQYWWASFASIAVLGYTAWQTRLIQPKLFPSWLMLALAMLCNPLAGILGGIIQLLDRHFDSVLFINFFVLIVYPLFLLAVALLPSNNTRKLELIQWLFDGLIVVFSITLIYWVFITQPDLLATHKDRYHLIYSVASQTGDLLIIWAMLMLLFRRLQHQRIEPLLWLFAGFFILLIYDLITASVTSSFSISSYGSLKEILLNASFLFLTMAGIQQLLTLKNPIKTNTRFLDYWLVGNIAFDHAVYRIGRIIWSLNFKHPFTQSSHHPGDCNLGGDHPAYGHHSPGIGHP